MARKHTADFTAHTAIVVCRRPGCHWRALSHSPGPAWRLYAAHCRLVHDDTTEAKAATRRGMRTRAV